MGLYRQNKGKDRFGTNQMKNHRTVFVTQLNDFHKAGLIAFRNQLDNLIISQLK